jgi:tetratricopeptide (TPR) repeat protein
MFKKTNVILTIIILLFLLQVVAVDVNGQPDEKTVKKIEKLMKKGTESANKKDFAKAMEAFNNALALSADYAPIHFNIARVYNMEKKFDDSIASLEKALQIQPDYAPAIDLLTKTLLGLGGEMAKQGQPEKANEYYLKLLNIKGLGEPVKLSALLHIGLNYAHLGNPVKSNEYLIQIVETPGIETSDSPKYIEASYRLGMNYYQLQKFEEVVKHFSKLVQLEELKTKYLKIYTFAVYLLGVSNSQLNEPAKANTYLLEYLQMTQNNPSDQFAPLANFLVGSNNFSMLESEIQPIKSSKDKDAFKKIVELAKSKTDILPYLTKAVELNPDLEPAYTLLGNYYFYCEDYEKSLQTYNTLIEKFANSPDIEQYKKFLENIKKAKDNKK